MDTRIKVNIKTEILTLKEVKNFLKFNDEDSDEEMLIINMIAAVRAHFEKKTGLSFTEKTYETLFHFYDKPYILPVAPVISVDTVEVIDYQGTKMTLTLNSGYYKRGLYEIEIQPFGVGTSDTLLVTYKAGYGHDDTEPLPEDLKDAMRKQIMQWYDNRDDYREFNILGSIDKVLQLYKTRVI